MHALFVRTLLVDCPVVIVLGCMCPGPSNNNNNNYSLPQPAADDCEYPFHIKCIGDIEFL